MRTSWRIRWSRALVSLGSWQIIDWRADECPIIQHVQCLHLGSRALAEPKVMHPNRRMAQTVSECGRPYGWAGQPCRSTVIADFMLASDIPERERKQTNERRWHLVRCFMQEPIENMLQACAITSRASPGAVPSATGVGGTAVVSRLAPAFVCGLLQGTGGGEQPRVLATKLTVTVLT